MANLNFVPKKILVYRRTHTGDPSKDTGVFGIHDCMKSVRDWPFDSVIGIGGTKPWRGYENISKKVTWVGVDAHKRSREISNNDYSGSSIVTFERIKILDENGPLLEDVSLTLYRYMFIENRIPRTAMNFSNDIFSELKRVIELVFNDDFQKSCNTPTSELEITNHEAKSTRICR